MVSSHVDSCGVHYYLLLGVQIFICHFPAFCVFHAQVAGSSIEGLNGLYHRVENVDSQLGHHEFQLAYLNDHSKWVMGFVKAPGPDAGYKAIGRHRDEWVFIDPLPTLRDRFGHEGHTIIPGSGTRCPSNMNFMAAVSFLIGFSFVLVLIVSVWNREAPAPAKCAPPPRERGRARRRARDRAAATRGGRRAALPAAVPHVQGGGRPRGPRGAPGDACVPRLVQRARVLRYVVLLYVIISIDIGIHTYF